MVKVQIHRLCSRGLIRRLDAKHGRGASGTVFVVADAALIQLKRDQETGSNGIIKRDQETGSNAGSSSGSLLISSTPPGRVTEERARLARFQLASTRLGLEPHGVDANDLMKLWRLGVFSDEAELLQSAEHFAFYLATENAKSIRSPKSVFLATLKAGYWAPPAGFRSVEERLAEEKLRATEERLHRLHELREKQDHAEFEIWLRELSDARWQELLRGTPWAGRRVLNEVVKNVLRPAFLAERGEGETP